MAENKPEKKLPEANFEVSSLAEAKDENGNGVFHMRTKTKFILLISILVLLAAGALIFLTVENYFAAEIWQLAVWGLCGVLAIYSIFARSIPIMLLNLVLFFGVSLIPVWQAGHETFKPVIEKVIELTSPAEVETPAAVEENKSAPVAIEKTAEKVSEPAEVERNAEVEKSAEKNVENKSVEITPTENAAEQDNSSVRDLPRI